MAIIVLVKNQPVKAYNLHDHTYVRFRVIGNGTLFLGHTSGEVLSQTGSIILAADGLVELHWIGELWASCDVSSPVTQYNIDPDVAFAPADQTESPAGAFRTNPPNWREPKNQTFDYGVTSPPLCEKIKNLLSGKTDTTNGQGIKLFNKE